MQWDKIVNAIEDEKNCGFHIKKIAAKEEPGLTKNELVDIAKRAGMAKQKSRVKQAWNRAHPENV